MLQNSISFSAAVIRQKGGPFQIEKVTCTDLRDDEVLVRVVAAGMCHTDMVALDQLLPVPLQSFWAWRRWVAGFERSSRAITLC